MFLLNGLYQFGELFKRNYCWIKICNKGELVLHQSVIDAVILILNPLITYFCSVRNLKKWRYFKGKMGILCKTTSLKLRIFEWWLIKFRSPCIKVFMIVIPICICWEIWKIRKKANFERFSGDARLFIKNVESKMKSLLYNVNFLSKQ